MVEGSTGAGGLKDIDPSVVSAPIEFSIESVAANCQFTKVVRFQLTGPPPSDSNLIPNSGQKVTANTLYLNPQQIDADRSCTSADGISPVGPLP
jgi:hypothetical protein